MFQMLLLLHFMNTLKKQSKAITYINADLKNFLFELINDYDKIKIEFFVMVWYSNLFFKLNRFFEKFIDSNEPA